MTGVQTCALPIWPSAVLGCVFERHQGKSCHHGPRSQALYSLELWKYRDHKVSGYYWKDEGVDDRTDVCLINQGSLDPETRGIDYWLSHWAPVDVTNRTGWDFLIKGLHARPGGADAAGGSANAAV